MKFEDDLNLKHKDKEIYIVTNHNWAFAAWEMAKLTGKLKPNATLVHVDAHLDNVSDGAAVEGIKEIKTKDDIKRVTESDYMKIENFIWAGMASDTVQHVFYVSHQKYCSDNINDIMEYEKLGFELSKEEQSVIDSKDCTAFRFRYVEDFKTFIDYKALAKYYEDKSLILDVDLDYFNLNQVTTDAELMSDTGIYNTMRNLRDLMNWDVITVAKSPSFCGGEEEANHILSILLEVFELDMNDFEEFI